MKKLAFLLVVILVVYPELKGQVTKGNWLVGGNGSFYSSRSTYKSPDYYQASEEFNLYAGPNIGYFLADRFVLGVRPYFSWGKGEVTSTSGVSSNVKRYGIGPFARYYLLNAEKPFNILTEATYQYGTYKLTDWEGPLHYFSVSAGPVIYLNNCVGLEFFLGYAFRSERYGNGFHFTQKGLQVGTGFQIHLEKE